MNKRQFIAQCLRFNRKSYILAVILIFIVNWLQVEIPRYIQLAIDLIDDSSATGHADLSRYVWVVVAMSAVMIVARIFSRIYALNPGRIIEAMLKNKLLQKLNRLPNSFHEKFSSGSLISIINNDLNGVRMMFGTGFLQLVNVFFALSLTPLWMWRISPELTLYSAIPISIAFVIFRIGFKRMKKYNAEHLYRLQDLSAQLMKFLAGIDLIKNQQMSPWVQAEVEKRNQRLLRCRIQISRIQIFIMPVLDYANNVMKILILGLGGYMLMKQELTLGEITAFLSYSVLLAMPLMQLGRIATIYQRGMLSIESVQRILNAQVPEQDQSILSQPEVDQLKGKTLSVRNLNFSYDDSRLVLKNISFDVPVGKKVGVLGSIGSGKTTLVNCLNHYLEVPKGTVFLGDRDITSFARSDLHRYMKTITQTPYLFSATIEENIRFGSDNESIDKYKIEQVLELSQLANDVSRFDKGDQTLVGEKGIMLSGGQKQRLSIARALLNPIDLIIMDDVLSAVDYETERKILLGVFQRLENQSALVVSHRVSALEYMDEIIVLHEGAMIAKGSHQALLKTCPYYYETWQLQQNEAEEQQC
ncbi:multidrug ABC transporter ATP-binding protein [Psychromonas marina]|uniref:Multidrug ABC transporter ATP-binding protein n=1 Tax=Psychromonas marina TaxID=88364 RepID=A0ABQ6DZJ8_9GAMM|nr:ABC transporter ATP-binding protein [Psychromonas marina]GLS90591.1 multidrug ABC transporter ATP-binding protein [Psychromonas marina]